MFVLERMTGKGYGHFSASGKLMSALTHISLENIVHAKKSLECVSYVTGVHSSLLVNIGTCSDPS